MSLAFVCLAFQLQSVYFASNHLLSLSPSSPRSLCLFHLHTFIRKWTKVRRRDENDLPVELIRPKRCTIISFVSMYSLFLCRFLLRLPRPRDNYFKPRGFSRSCRCSSLPSLKPLRRIVLIDVCVCVCEHWRCTGKDCNGDDDEKTSSGNPSDLMRESSSHVGALLLLGSGFDLLCLWTRFQKIFIEEKFQRFAGLARRIIRLICSREKKHCSKRDGKLRIGIG